MAIESTDDLKDLPHVVILRRGNEMTIREFAGAGCMERAHDYAQREALGARDVEAVVAMRYRRIGGPGVPIAAALADPTDSVVAARYVRAAELERQRAENKALRESIDLLRLPRALADAARDVVLVLDAATALVGDRQKALQWYREHPIADFGGLTPMRVLQEGKTQAVLDYIESLSAGASG